MNKLEFFLTRALEEDCPNGDITTETLGINNQQITAQLISKDTGIFFGQEILETVAVIHRVEILSLKMDGDILQPKDIICEFRTTHHICLIIERVILNFLQHLSGVSSLTAQFVQKLDDPTIAILDTRKTIPGLRSLQKKAVRAGGGYNHRFHLSDMILIKENHLTVLKNERRLHELDTLIKNQKLNHPEMKAEVEIESLDQLQSLNLRSVDYILLDNFRRDDIVKAATICKKIGYQAELEVSGNISLDTIHLYKSLPIQRISVGKLTHSVNAFDISLLIKSNG